MARLAASTLGLPDAGLDEIVAVLTAGGCSGVELRAGENQAVHTGSTRPQRLEVRRALAAAGLHPLAVSSYVKICAPGNDREIVDELTAYVDLAADLGADGVRIFPGGAKDDGDDERGARRLVEAAGPAARRGVRLLLETHDSHPRGADVARLLDRTGRDDIEVIWDFVHPWRNGESPADTRAAIGSRLAYVQLKDTTADGPALVSAGDVPLDDIRTALTTYDGWWSVEWEKAWYPEIPPLSEALASARSWLPH